MSKLYWMNQVIATDNAEYIDFIPGSNTGLVSTKTGPAIREVAVKAKGSQTDISALQTKTNTIQTNLTNVTTRVGTLENEFTANGTRIYMDYKNGKYGYNLSANRGADTFFPFSMPPTMSQIFSGEVGISVGNTSYFYTTTKEYKYIVVYMEEVDSADINVWLSPTAGTEYFSQREGHDARIFEIWRDIPASTRLGLSASRWEHEEEHGTMRGYVFGVSTAT